MFYLNYLYLSIYLYSKPFFSTSKSFLLLLVEKDIHGNNDFKGSVLKESDFRKNSRREDGLKECGPGEGGLGEDIFEGDGTKKDGSSKTDNLKKKS